MKAQSAGSNQYEPYALLAPEGRITAKTNPKQPAVPLFTGVEPVRVFDWFVWEDCGGLDPHIHSEVPPFVRQDHAAARSATSTRAH
nr:hypothetical protein GCM10025732_29770 [Glycomyces mayteni]